MGKKKKSSVTDTSQQTQRKKKGNPKPLLKKVLKRRSERFTALETNKRKFREERRKALVDLSHDTAVVDLKPGCSVVDFVGGKTTKEQQIKGKKTRGRNTSAPIKGNEDSNSSDCGPSLLITSSSQSAGNQWFQSDDSSSVGTDSTSSDDVYVVDLQTSSAKGKATRSSPRKTPPKQPEFTQNRNKTPKKETVSIPQQSQITKSPATGSTPSYHGVLPATPQLARLKQQESSSASNFSTPEREIKAGDSDMEFMSDGSNDDDEAETSAGGVAEERNSAPLIPQATYQKQRARLLPHTEPTHCIALLHPLSLLPFYGQLKVTVVHGEVKVNGYVLSADSKPVVVYSPKCSPALCLETPNHRSELYEDEARLKDRISHLFTEENRTSMLEEVLLSMVQDGASVVLIEPHWSDRTGYVTSFPKYEDLFEKKEHRKWGKGKLQQQILSSAHNIGFSPVHPDTDTPVLTTPLVYYTVSDTMLQALDQTGPQPVAMVCGWRNVGKSTMARYLINTMLNKSDAVCLLDCDVGQTEFNPPTMLGITVITEPLLGPPFTHDTKPERMCFYGDISPANSPDVYLSILQYLYQYYLDNLQHMPLVVNCMGWMIGIGLDLLIDTIRIMQPSHLFQLLPTPKPKKAPILNKEYLLQARGWSKQTMEGGEKSFDMEFMLLNMPWRPEVGGRGYKASHYREMSLLSYLSQLMPPKLKNHDPLATFDPLHALIPFAVPWGLVGVHVCNADVPPRQLMYALNGSVVGLCKADPQEMIPLESEDSSDLPKIFHSAPICECLGLGIIRGIDPINKMFYIISHLSKSTLTGVNALLKGSLALPKYMLQPGQNSRTVPYVTTEYLHGVTGAGTIKARYQLPKNQSKSS